MTARIISISTSPFTSASSSRFSRPIPCSAFTLPPSPLSDIQPEHWPAEYTTDLLDLLNVLGRLVALEPQQDKLLNEILRAKLLGREGLVIQAAAKTGED